MNERMRARRSRTITGNEKSDTVNEDEGRERKKPGVCGRERKPARVSNHMRHSLGKDKKKTE